MPEQSREDATSHKQLLPWWVWLCRRLWKTAAFLGASVILSLALNVASTWLTSSKGSIPSDSPFGVLRTNWPIVLLLGCCLLLMALLSWVLSRWYTQPPVILSQTLQNHAPLTPQNRACMIGRLRRSYSDLNVQTLQGMPRIDMYLFERPDAVQNTATFWLRSMNQSEHLLPAGTSILDAYDQAEHNLLILGAPGAGKSTLLLVLAQQLVERAVHDKEHPLPVILSLSSWTVKRPPLENWIVEQFMQIDDILRHVGEQGIQEGVILPLLDGLDQMDEAARSACIAAINVYQQTHLGVPLVICSRTAEYVAVAQDQRLVLQRAMVVQPLTFQQVDTYLFRVGNSVAALQSSMKKKHVLQELATTPLMLSVLMLTYQGTTIQELPKKEALLQQRVWTVYVQHMVSRKGDTKHYPQDVTCAWLSWLAREMLEHNQTSFSLEQLQSDWLPKRQKVVYRWSVMLISGLLVAVCGLVCGLYIVTFGELFFGLVFGLVTGLVFGLLGVLFGRLDIKIVPVEALTWSWKDLRSKLLSRLRIALLGGLLSGLLFALLYTNLGYGLFSVLIITPFFWLIAGLLGGLSRKQLTECFKLSPNEGIRCSIKNGLVIALLCGLVIGSFFWLMFDHASEVPIYGLLFGLGGGLLCGLPFGISAALQHYTLRFWLWRTQTFPFKVIPFLEDATTRILLYRVGRSYSFSYQSLLDYFADLDQAGASTFPTKASRASMTLSLLNDSSNNTEENSQGR